MKNFIIKENNKIGKSYEEKDKAVKAMDRKFFGSSDRMEIKVIDLGQQKVVAKRIRK